MTVEELARWQSISIMELKREELADAGQMQIDTRQSRQKRVQSYLEQTANPFALNVGEYILQIGYMPESSETIEDRMLELARKQARIL